MMRALIAVLTRPWPRSPLASFIHHITMAVHGEIPSRMTPAMNWGLPLRKMFANNTIRGGAMTQLAMMVISIGFGNLVAFLTSLKLIPITVGYIMRKRRMPMGIDKWPTFRESRYWPNWGRNLPKSRPMTMQMAIQRVRYFSKCPRDTSSEVPFSDVMDL